MKINQRITDLKKVKKEYSIPRPGNFRVFLIYLPVIFIFLLVGYLSNYEKYFYQPYKVYSEVQIGKKKSLVELSAKNPDQIILTNENSQDFLTIKKDTITKLLTENVYIKKGKIDYVMVSQICISILLVLLLAISYTIRIIKARKKYNKFKNFIKEINDFENIDMTYNPTSFFPFY